MTNSPTRCLIALVTLSFAACVDAGPEVGSIAYRQAGTAEPAVAAEGAMQCPTPEPGLVLRRLLCNGSSCDQAVIDEFDRPGAWAEVAEDVYVHRTSAPASWNACDQLPATGACALACDNAALIEEYVRPGECVMFLCTLTDGTEMLAGGCHL